MKRKILLVLTLALLTIFGCKNENASPKEVDDTTKNVNSVEEDTKKSDSDKSESDESNTEKSDTDESSTDKSDNDKSDTDESVSKTPETLKPVKGAIFGSMSSYVEDREIWNDFVDEKHLDYVNKEGHGMHLPRILLDSKDAKDANAEIDKIEEHLKDLYVEHENDMEDDDTGIYAAFSVYQDESVLSIMVETYSYWEGDYRMYNLFNFSIPDGKYIDDFELMKNFGVEKEELLGLVESNLKENQELVTKIYYAGVRDSSFISTPRSFTGAILNNLWSNYDATNNQIYINEMGEPYFVFSTREYEIPQAPEILKLKSNKFDESPISDEYIKMARKLGIDPNDEKYKAFIIFLGAAFDEDSLKKTLQKLNPWENMFNDYEDPSMLLTVKYDDSGQNPYLNGQECYLVVPKYKNASVALKELELSNEGKLKEVENSYLDYSASAGSTFICQNISEIAPNAKIIIRYRDDIFEFSPSISLKDGSLIVPDEIYNAEDLLDWNNYISEGYSIDLFDVMNSMMPKG